MLITVNHVTFDCVDAYTISGFWIDLLGSARHQDDCPGDPECIVTDPSGRHGGLLFVQVPEGKAVKNRVHLDLQPQGESRDDAVIRALSLGATMHEDHRRDDGTGWVTLLDPEGNELCIERSAAERGARAGTGERPFGDMQTADERPMLNAMIDWYRAGVVAKFAGWPEPAVRSSATRSASTPIGLLNHLALVEDTWMSERLAGEPVGQWASAPHDNDSDWEFHSAAHEPVAVVVARYEAACARSRSVVASRPLDGAGAKACRTGVFTLRFALLHLIDETARHLGHLDILRELADGTTGE